MALVYKCDICGKTINRSSMTSIDMEICEGLGKDRTYDLCPDCAEAIIGVFEGRFSIADPLSMMEGNVVPVIGFK